MDCTNQAVCPCHCCMWPGWASFGTFESRCQLLLLTTCSLVVVLPRIAAAPSRRHSCLRFRGALVLQGWKRRSRTPPDMHAARSNQTACGHVSWCQVRRACGRAVSPKNSTPTWTMDGTSGTPANQQLAAWLHVRSND